MESIAPVHLLTSDPSGHDGKSLPELAESRTEPQASSLSSYFIY